MRVVADDDPSPEKVEAAAPVQAADLFSRLHRIPVGSRVEVRDANDWRRIYRFDGTGTVHVGLEPPEGQLR